MRTQRERDAGYLRVLREAPGYRLLFVARVVSMLGDWMSLLATVALLREVAGSSPRALSVMLILRLLPFFLAGPLAGVVADRFSRKSIMIATDLVRLGLALGLIAAPWTPFPVKYVYVLVALQVVAGAFFEPARAAALPQLVPPRMLAAANALGAIAWSMTFAVGAALGGVVADLLGWRIALAIDAGTYLISALILARIVLPRRPARPKGPVDWLTLTGFRDFREGLRFIRLRPAVAAIISVKSGWGIAGAVTLFLALYGERVYPIAGSPDLGVALLLAARAVGTGIGPILARRVIVDESPAAMRKLLTVAFLFPMAGYLVFAWVTHPWLAAACVVVAHFGGSVLWVYSTLLLQRTIPNRLLGRISSTDLALATLSMSASNWIYGLLAEPAEADLRTLVRVMAASLAIPTIGWWVAAGRWKPGVRATADRYNPGAD